MNPGLIAVFIAALAAPHEVIATAASDGAATDPAPAAAERGVEEPASPGPPGRLMLRGRVTDATGRAIPAVRIFLEGAQREIAVPDRNGRFALEVAISPIDSLIRAPLALWLNARRNGWRVGLASGAPRLRLELRAFDDSLGARHMSLRTNDTTATAALARAFEDGVADDTIEVAFIGAPGKDPEPRDVALDAVADVVVVPGRVTSYATPVLSGEAPAPSGAAAMGSGPAAVPPAMTPASPRAAAAPHDSCVCRIEGTIEVQWDRPLPERVPVTLWVEGAPAVRDSVDLLLGSPRGFVLPALGCGPHRVAYTAYSRLRFIRLTPDPVVECTDQGQRQLRIVLEPVRPRLSR